MTEESLTDEELLDIALWHIAGAAYQLQALKAVPGANVLDCKMTAFTELAHATLILLSRIESPSRDSDKDDADDHKLASPILVSALALYPHVDAWLSVVRRHSSIWRSADARNDDDTQPLT